MDVCLLVWILQKSYGSQNRSTGFSISPFFPSPQQQHFQEGNQTDRSAVSTRLPSAEYVQLAENVRCYIQIRA